MLKQMPESHVTGQEFSRITGVTYSLLRKYYLPFAVKERVRTSSSGGRYCAFIWPLARAGQISEMEKERKLRVKLKHESAVVVQSRGRVKPLKPADPNAPLRVAKSRLNENQIDNLIRLAKYF